MKKLCLLLVFLLCVLSGCRTPQVTPEVALKTSPDPDVVLSTPNIVLSSGSSGVINIEGLSLFSASWLHEYSPQQYDLDLHPYTINDFELGDMKVLWDFDSDGIVNLQDFSIFAQLDIDQMLSDMQVLKEHPLTEEEIETLALAIYNKEQDLGILNFRLFKILLHLSDFDVFVYDYVPDDEIFVILFWESQTQKGWLDIHWWKTTLGFQYTYEYLIENKNDGRVIRRK
jgi:hypothetical protein